MVACRAAAVGRRSTRNVHAVSTADATLAAAPKSRPPVAQERLSASVLMVAPASLVHLEDWKGRPS